MRGYENSLDKFLIPSIYRLFIMKIINE